MKLLFVHQNFPAQFRFLATALAGCGHEVAALDMRNGSEHSWMGVSLHHYSVQRGTTAGVHPWVADFETKVIRGEACFRKALEMKGGGFCPDLIIAHHGWGESLFLKDVWPQAKLALYCEYYYQDDGGDVGFDAEFDAVRADDVPRLRLKNLNNLLHLGLADAAISPTAWQAATFPAAFRDKITVIHDGIDTTVAAPNPEATATLNGRVALTVRSEVITFVNRNLEPHRGYHVFMRSLPALLKRRPNARILLVGGDDVSYGARPPAGKSWKNVLIEEVRASISDTDWQRVHFLGRVPYQEYLTVLQLSTVHVYLSYPFVLSWSLLEAMSAACAIVASDTAPVREVLRHDDTGRLVDFFDTGALCEAICQLTDDPGARRRLGAAARAVAIKRFDLQSVCLPRQLAWIEQLLGNTDE